MLSKIERSRVEKRLAKCQRRIKRLEKLYVAQPGGEWLGGEENWKRLQQAYEQQKRLVAL